LANTQALRRRIRSVKSTQQITKAMKMVAAARLRRAQNRIEEARPYANGLHEVLSSVAARVQAHRHTLLRETEERHVTLVVITGDKGLCGAFNANVQREAMALLGSKRWEVVELVLVGRKGIDFFRYKGIDAAEKHPDLMSGLTLDAAFALGRRLAVRFASGKTDAVYLLSNHFRSIIQQEVRLDRLLPIRRSDLGEEQRHVGYVFEPQPSALLDQLLPRHVEFQILRALLSSLAAEHAARMTAMDAASKNAAEMIDQLTLTYNRVRQASITKELIEIVSGAEALGER
jgi:F-type H+-transporting ATPase subunit gamma